MATRTSETETFGALLRQHRLAAGLSQEQLAERAQLSVDAVAALERRRRTAPRPGTVVLLADALRLTSAERAALISASAAAKLGGLAKPDGVSPPLVMQSSLPVQVTSFIGRERDVAEVRGLLGATRLLTLTGAGGIGKTRLALQVAAEVRCQNPHGVVALVELAALADPGRVPETVAATLGIVKQADRPTVEVLAAALLPCRLLLLIDGCEHVVSGCAELANRLLLRCPNLSLLVTSREGAWDGG